MPLDIIVMILWSLQTFLKDLDIEWSKYRYPQDCRLAWGIAFLNQGARPIMHIWPRLQTNDCFFFFFVMDEPAGRVLYVYLFTTSIQNYAIKLFWELRLIVRLMKTKIQSCWTDRAPDKEATVSISMFTNKQCNDSHVQNVMITNALIAMTYEDEDNEIKYVVSHYFQDFVKKHTYI